MEQIGSGELFVCDENHVHLVINPQSETDHINTSMAPAEARHLALGLLEMANRIEPPQ